MPLSAGQKLATYEIVSALGAGGMGEVYRARDTRLGRDVAIKILPPEVTSEPGRLERFDREARAIAALNHPHIVTIYSTEEADGLRFLTMELVDGQTLSELVVSSGMAVTRFLEIAMPLADALAAAHQKQITHRDLKPGNVMISHEGRVKVLDFGLARIGGGDFGENSVAATAAPITNRGVIVGTMPYMSPEQVEGRPIDARSDLFSLGVIFYELLSGKRPFAGGSSPALMSAILRDTPTAISASRADLPEGLERLVDRLIEKRPEDRVQTARDVFNELKHIRRSRDDSSSGRSSGRVDARSGLTAPPHNLWIAVLPFSVRGTDHDAAELAAGLTDDIAAGLTKFQVFNVVAAQSTRAYKDSALDVRQIADRLGARYVIGGNVRTSARIVRATAQLIDSSSGAQLWSESYDRDATAMDLFAIQDDVTDHIVATIGDQSGVLARSMAKAVRSHLPPSEQTSRELILRAWALRHNTEPVEHARLRDALEIRVTTEPDNSDLWAELAHLYLDEQILVMNQQPDPLGRAGRAARRSVEIDPNNQRGWTELAAACFFTKDRAGLFDGGERAIAINPRNAYTLGWIGNLFTHAGDYDRGSKLAERGMAINPRHPGWCHIGPFNKHFVAGDYAAALRSARRINMPELNWSYFAVATAAAHLNLMDEARQAADRMVAITPSLADAGVLRELTELWFWEPAMVEALLDGVQRAISAGSATAHRPRTGATTSAGSRPPSSASGSTGGGALTVAVRPFVSRGADDESRSLADGLTDDIINGLSKFGYLRVLSRSLAERLAIDRELLHARARYEVEGQVRRSGTQLRIGVTLVDTQTGSNLWTHSTDHAIDDGTFAVQDAVSSAVVATIGDQTGVLMRAMAAAAADRPLDQLSVAELVVRYHLYAESFDPQEHARLRAAFEHALEREPRAAEGWACLALIYEHEHSFGFNTRPDSQSRERRAAERANELDPNSQQAWIAMASVHFFARDLEAMKNAVERAASINPLNADLLALGGIFLSAAGEDDRALVLVQQAIRLKPQHAGWYYFPLFNAAYRHGDYEEALRANKKAGLQRMPLQHMNALAVSGRLGLRTEARAALRALREMDPVLCEPGAARAVWSKWSWSDDFVSSREDGFRQGLALASEPS